MCWFLSNFDDRSLLSGSGWHTASRELVTIKYSPISISPNTYIYYIYIYIYCVVTRNLCKCAHAIYYELNICLYLQLQRNNSTIDPVIMRPNCVHVNLLHKSHNAPVPYPTIHHFLTEMCTCVQPDLSDLPPIGMSMRTLVKVMACYLSAQSHRMCQDRIIVYWTVKDKLQWC